MLSAGFVLTSLVVVLVPGTGVIYTVSTALAGKRRHALLAALGCTMGIIPHLAAGILGLSALLHMGARIFQIIKLGGVVYLLFLGYNMIRSHGFLDLDGESAGRSDMTTVGRGILLNLLNPKLTLFFFSFLPQFLVDSEFGYTAQMVFLSLLFMAMTLGVFILYGMLAHSFKNLIRHSRNVTKRIQQGFGLILIGFAAKLAVSEN